MTEKDKGGSSADPKKTVDDMRKTFPYFRIEDARTDFVRQGNQWAHPYAAEAMSMDEPAVIEQMASQVDPGKLPQELREMRDAFGEANKERWDQINQEHPEFEEYGFWESYEADPCIEEPDAPKVPILVRRLRPSFKKGPYPVVFVIAVGGLFMHDPYMFLNAPITKFFGCELVAAQIRTYPDAKYPAAVNDLHAAYQWMIDHVEELDIDVDRIIITGSSSGGHLAAALPFRLKRFDWCGAPMPRGVVTFDAFYDDRETGRSMRTIYKGWDGLVNRAANMRYMGENFASGFIGPEAYANHATDEECVGLPPYAIYENQDCPGCDSAIEFTKKLNRAGDFCSFAMGGGCGHSGPMEQLTRIGVFFDRDTDYVPTLGVDRISRMEAFYVGCIKDFMDFDLRRITTSKALG